MRRMMISTTATRATSSARMMRTVGAPSAEVNRQRLGATRARPIDARMFVGSMSERRARAEPSRRAERRVPRRRRDATCRRFRTPSCDYKSIGPRAGARSCCRTTPRSARTMNPAAFLRALGPEPWNVCYPEPSVASGRFEVRGEPESGAETYSVSSHPETGAGERAGDVFGIARGVGHRHRGATCASSRTVGNPQCSGRGVSGGRCGWTAWR